MLIFKCVGVFFVVGGITIHDAKAIILVFVLKHKK